MANTLSYTQGGYTVTISTDGSDLTTPSTANQIYLNETQTDKITFTFSDGASFYLTDFSESTSFSTSTARINVAGIAASANSGYINTLNIIPGYGYGARFDVYDTNSGIQLANDFRLDTAARALTPSQNGTFSPAAVFNYSSGGTLSISAATGSLDQYVKVNDSGALVSDGVRLFGVAWGGTYATVASYSLVASNPMPVTSAEFPSVISIGRFAANNEWCGSGEHLFNLPNCTASINFSSQVAGFIGASSRTITILDLSNLYQTSSSVSVADGEHALPFDMISTTLLEEVLGAQSPLQPLHYLYACDFTGYGTAQASNELGNSPDVLIINNSPNQTCLHSLDLSNFKGLAIVGEGINISGLNVANNAIVQGDATYTMSAGNEMIVLKGGGCTVNGGLGIDTVYFADSSEASARVTETSENSCMVMTNQGLSILNDIERLRFNDGVIALDTGVGENAGEIFRLYQAMFGRTADETGTGFWLDQIDNGATLTSIANQFLVSKESQATYGSVSDLQFINLLYQNVLHRTADDAGFNYWQGVLNSGTDHATVLASFSESHENVIGVAAQITNGVAYQPWLG